MSRCTTTCSRGTLTRALVVLVVAGLCCGAVAYAANRPGKPKGNSVNGRKAEKLPAASLIETPEAATTLAEPQFRFHVAPRSPDRPPTLSAPSGPGGEPMPPRRFQCRLDGGEWRGCDSPHRLGGLGRGDHYFGVRAFSRDGHPGPVAGYSWRQRRPVAPGPVPPPQVGPEPNEPKQFTIESRSTGLGDLYPGRPAQPLPVLISNPHSVAIEVTGLTVAVAGGKPSCAGENFEVTPSSASPATPLPVPAGSSVTLPSATVSAPSIAIRDLPVNQDACQGAEIPLVFSGEARG